MNDFSENGCQLEDVAAYLDGELDGAELNRFEVHLKTCNDCAAELRAQRQLLCTLDIAFNGTRSFNLPNNFARVVTARAESDLSGMRNKHERRRAAKLCVVLALISFALLGAATQTIVVDPVRSVFKATASLLELIWQASSEAAISIGVVGRVIARAVLLGQGGLGVFLLAFFVLSVSFLPLLLARYHSAQTIE